MKKSYIWKEKNNGKDSTDSGKKCTRRRSPLSLHILTMTFCSERTGTTNDIDVKTRSIITVVALMAQGITDSSLKFHLQNAKDHGVTQKEIAAIITHVAFYAGWPKGWAVFNLAKEVWNEDETEE